MASSCTICLDEFTGDDTTVVLIKCGHIFHQNCIERYFDSEKKKCPLCLSEDITFRRIYLSFTDAPRTAKKPDNSEKTKKVDVEKIEEELKKRGITRMYLELQKKYREAVEQNKLDKLVAEAVKEHKAKAISAKS